MERADYTREGIDRWLAKLDDRVQSRLRRFRIEMEEEGLRSSTVRTWLSKARVFLGYLADRSKEPEDAGPSDIVAFVRMRLRICRRRRGSPPAYFVGWRCSYTGAIQRLLRNIQGQWPPTTAWTSRLERTERIFSSEDSTRSTFGSFTLTRGSFSNTSINAALR